VQLLSSSIEAVCPGETVEFTCTVYHRAQLRWNSIPFDRAITFVPTHSPGRVVNRGNTVANLTSVQIHPLNNLAANMTSTLTFPASNNTEVFCEEESLSVNVSGKWCVMCRDGTLVYSLKRKFLLKSNTTGIWC